MAMSILSQDDHSSPVVHPEHDVPDALCEPTLVTLAKFHGLGVLQTKQSPEDRPKRQLESAMNNIRSIEEGSINGPNGR